MRCVSNGAKEQESAPTHSSSRLQRDVMAHLHHKITSIDPHGRRAAQSGRLAIASVQPQA